MALNTPNLNLPYPVGSDAPPDVAQALRVLSERLDAIAMSHGQGPHAEMPVAKAPGGRIYWATDRAQMYFDTGTDWVAIPGGGLIPIGGVLDWPATTNPPGPAEWRELNGDVITRADYPELFAAWNITGATTTLQDRRGRSPMGAGQGAGLSSRAVGDRPGSEAVTLQVSNLPAHGHTGSTSAAGSHTHGMENAGAHRHTFAKFVMAGIHGFSSVADANNYYKKFNAIAYEADFTNVDGLHYHNLAASGQHDHTVTVGNTGGGVAAPNVHPSVVTRYFVRAR